MSRLIDLTGQQFGRLTVIERVEHEGKGTKWLCECECGNKKEVFSSNLRRGLTTSCGCFRKEKLSKLKLEDLTGQKFGKLTVIKLHHYNEKSRQYYWECKCDCGGTATVYSGHLKNGHTKSCGCIICPINIIGKRYGKLVVVEQDIERTKKEKAVFWKCLCDCGTIISTRTTHLNSGKSESCGCTRSKGEELINKLFKENNISYSREVCFNDCRNDKTGHCLRFDFVIYNQNKEISHIVEYNGSQHYLNYPEAWGESLEEVQRRDNIKKEYCANNKIPLIVIPYTSSSSLIIEDLLI